MSGHRAPTKIVDFDALLARRDEARLAGRRVVHCHGCFDIVHPGHIRHLKFARSQGDILLVSVTGDEEVRKGTGRPLIPQELRAENLAELDCVDWVYVEPRATAQELLEAVRPDVYIKGREYEFNNDPRFRAERETVERHGGRVVFSSGDVVFSSSALIEAMEHSIDPFHHRLSRLLEDSELQPTRLEALVASMRGRRVVIVGETIRDTYVFCDRPDVAGESPMMTLRPVENRFYDGGAAILARHAVALGARPLLVTAMPDDEAARAMRSRLESEGIEVRAIRLPTPLPEKQRYLVGATKVMKVDLVQQAALDARERDRFAALAAAACDEEGGCDAAIVADFGLGLLTPTLIGRLSTLLRPGAAVLAGDVSGRRAGLEQMKGMDLLCPSESELRDAERNYGDSLPTVAWAMMENTGARSAIVTMGAEGLIAFDRLATPTGTGWQSRLRGEHVPALTPHAVDALGCGDALLAAATLSLACGGSLLAAAFLGALAASVEARTLGNMPVGSATLRREVVRVASAHVRLTTRGLGVVETSRAIEAIREAS
ncbi:MAG: adenylyltransferase/cytidyltransferase family protein [Phycisphaeraceae bacterium]|nr:MAG: adenylyltransferase/cytidyltransferase family protein [Phycisphaeraceae bacterium]